MNKINKLLITTAILASFTVAGNAQVSSKNFTGPSVEIGLQQSTTKTTSDAGAEEWGANSRYVFTTGNFADDNSSLGRIAAQYGIPVAEKFVLGLGASYTAGSVSQDINSEYNTHNHTLSAKYDNMMALYLEPTYVVSDTTAVFAKVSYNRADAKMNAISNSSWYPYDYSASQTISGVGYGVGLTTFITKDVFLKAEIEQITYGKNDFDLGSYDVGNVVNAKTKQNNATISVGVKF
jgi:opacity protein-like surface antigen